MAAYDVWNCAAKIYTSSTLKTLQIIIVQTELSLRLNELRKIVSSKVSERLCEAWAKDTDQQSYQFFYCCRLLLHDDTEKMKFLSIFSFLMTMVISLVAAAAVSAANAEEVF